MRQAGKVFFVFIAIFVLALGGCGNRTPVGEDNTAEWARDLKLRKAQFTPAEQLEIITWYDYLPQEVFDLFTRTYGTKIVPTLVNSNEEMFELLRKNPGKYDLITPSDYMVTKMIKGGLLHRLDHKNLPNIESLDEDVRRTKYDRGLQYCVPLFRTSLGIAFNIKYVSGIPRNWRFLAEQIRNDYFVFRVGISKEMRFAMGVSLMLLGYSPNTTNSEEIAAARDLLIDLVKKRGLVLLDTDTEERLVKNETLLGVVWSGSAASALRKNPNIRFLLPEGQALVTFDNAVISAASTRARTAELFINYLLIPQVCARMTDYNYFPNSNSSSLPFIQRLIRNGPGFLFPQEDERLFLEDLGENITLYEEAWSEVQQATPDAALVKLPLPKDGFFKGDAQVDNFSKQFGEDVKTKKNGTP